MSDLPTSDLPRRRLLAVSGTALAGGLAGCSSDDGNGNGDDGNGGDGAENADEPEETETESTTDLEGTILGDITVDNSNDSARTVDVLVELDREIESWETVDLATNEEATLEREWSTDPGNFRVTARLDSESLVQVTPAKWNEPDCLNLLVRINGDGELVIHGNTDGGPCGTDDADA